MRQLFHLFSKTVFSVFFLKATLYTLEFLCFQVEPNKDWLAIPRFVQCIILLPALHYECLLITWHHQFWNWRPSWPRPYIITLLTTEFIQLFLCFKTIFNPLRNSVSFRRCLVPISSQHKSHGNKSLARCIWHSFVFLQNPCFVQKFNFDTFLYFFCKKMVNILEQCHRVWKSPKMSHLTFSILAFSPFFVLLKLTCLVTLFDGKLHVFKNSLTLTVFGIFNELLYTQNM